jgi:tetratricopeptide (TPR) repeat protein
MRTSSAIFLLLFFAAATASAQPTQPTKDQPIAQQPQASNEADSLALSQARTLLDKGEVDKALEALQALQTRNPTLAGLDRDLAVAYYRKSDYARASAYLEKVTAADRSDKEALQLLGLSYFFLGQPKKAIPLLEQVQSWFPTAHVDASYVLGVSYIQTQAYDNARKAFATMYGVSPESAASHLFLARMLLRQGHDPIAEEEMKKAIAVDPKLPLLHYGLGELYIFKSRIPEAIKEFEAELAINPGHAATYYRLADAYTRVMRWEDAERLLQQSIWLDATASGPFILMGKVLLKKNDPTLASRSLKRALSMDPNNYMAHNLLGQAYRALGMTAEAESELQTSQKLQAAQNRSEAELR